MINSADITKLRNETGAGVMDCKKALEEAQGDFNRAQKIIKEKGLIKAQKREGRETKAGRIEAYVHNNRVGVLVELRSETDFVANSEPFKELVRDMALQLVAMPAENSEEFLDQPYIKDDSKNIKDLINELISKVGENVVLGTFYRIEL